MGSVGGSAPVQNPGAMGVYNQQLAAMTQNYGNILAGYGQAQNNLQAGLGGVSAAYTGVRNDALNRLGLGPQSAGGWGVAAPAAADINRQFVQTQGANQQSLITAGLGNSSLLAQSNNQAAAFAGNSYAKLGSDLATAASGVETQVGLAGLAARQQGLGMQANLAQSYLGNLAGYNFAPKVDLYGQQSWSASGRDGGGGYGGGGGGGGTSGGGSPFSSWLTNSGVPAYSGGGSNYLANATGYSYGSPSAGGRFDTGQGFSGVDYEGGED